MKDRKFNLTAFDKVTTGNSVPEEKVVPPV